MFLKKLKTFEMTLVTKKCLLQPYLVLYVQFSQWAMFLKATPTNYRIRHNLNYYINERETPKTCLTNHKNSISHHITLLVINILVGRHTNIYTHTHTYSHCRQKQFQETSCALAKGRCASGLTTFCMSLYFLP